MSIRPRKQRLDPNQIPLITPDSDWVVPTELPSLRGVEEIALDTENKDDGLASGVGPGWALGMGYVAGVGVAWRTGTEIQRIYVPVRHPDTANFPKEQVARWVTDITRKRRVVMFNAGYDIGWLQTDMGVPIPPVIDDASCAAFLVDENREDLSLDGVCAWRGVPGKDLAALHEAANIYGYKKDEAVAKIAMLPARYAAPYGSQDPVSTLLAMENLRSELAKQGLIQAYNVEMRLIPIINAMRRRGIRIDLDRATQFKAKMLARSGMALEKLSAHLRRQVGMEDIRSSRWLLNTFDTEKVPYQYMGEGEERRATFDKDWMRRAEHWLPRLVAEAKQCHDMAEKFVGTYLLEFCHRGRIHASINQWKYEEGGTRSHRLSYADPPLQQAPSRPEPFDGWPLTGENAAEYRSCFLPEEGDHWFAPDYCHDEQTDVLTDAGWIKFKNLKNEMVAQWHIDTETLDFAVPLSKYVGPVRERVLTTVSSKHVNFRVTADHRCLLQNNETGEYDVVRAEMLDEKMLRRDWCIPQRAMMDNKSASDVRDDMLRLVVALQADASDRGVYGGSTWVFYMSKPRKLSRLRKLLRGLNISWREGEGGGGRTAIRLDDRPEFRKWLGDDKTFRINELMKLDQRQRMVFLEELMLWDGSRRNSTKIGGTYTSTNEANTKIISALASMSGYMVRSNKWPKQPRKKPCWAVILRKEIFKRRVQGGIHVRRQIVKGRVYCVTMPSGFIVTRRNGRVTIGGQSQQEYRHIVADAEKHNLEKASVAGDMYRNDPKTDFHNVVVTLTGLPRRHAKDCNFAKAFGAGVPKFATMINKPLAEAAEIMGTYDTELPFVKKLGEVCTAFANRKGYINMFDGARSHFDRYEAAYLSKDERARGYAWHFRMDPCSEEEARARQGQRIGDHRHPWYGARLKRAFTHKAMNRRIQGNAARQTKLAMVTCGEEGHIPMLQMHDELCFSLRDPKVGARIEEIMRTVYTCSVPFLVDGEWGRTWGEAKHTYDALVAEGRPARRASGKAPARGRSAAGAKGRPSGKRA